MLTTLLGWLLTYRYLMLFPIAVIEGPIIAIVAGSLAATGQFNFFFAYFIIIAGDLTGDSIYYALGRYGRSKIVQRWGHRIGLTEARAQKVDNHFDKHADKTLILGKLAFSLEVPVIFSAGLARYPYRRFLGYMTLGAMPKTLSLMLLGYFFGFSIAGAQHSLRYATIGSLAALVILGCLIIIVRFSRRKLMSQAARNNRSR